MYLTQLRTAIAFLAIAANKNLAQQLQSRLQDFWLLNSSDGLWGAKSAQDRLLTTLMQILTLKEIA
ncbi:hypothetical protein [Nostoc sp.]|uniref:hypothetical protein n=1 Tax=Nostoc sp. TaxID=1180 RepID=UPI002FFCFB43